MPLSYIYYISNFSHDIGDWDVLECKPHSDTYRGGFKEGRGGHLPPLPYLCNHFEELQTKLFQTELIINNAPLIYVLTPNYLLFGRQLSSNTTSTVTANLPGDMNI